MQAQPTTTISPPIFDPFDAASRTAVYFISFLVVSFYFAFFENCNNLLLRNTGYGMYEQYMKLFCGKIVTTHTNTPFIGPCVKRASFFFLYTCICIWILRIWQCIFVVVVFFRFAKPNRCILKEEVHREYRYGNLSCRIDFDMFSLSSFTFTPDPLPTYTLTQTVKCVGVFTTYYEPCFSNEKREKKTAKLP